ncbi:tetratricopeptide repeat protein, partial [Hymenobacter saemangeumensis]|uniref:tetratricopeptide repeat protein n=1 Tax=Hymenobacter saemangeumensis TaxID=1084522 RepID=UPI0031E84978
MLSPTVQAQTEAENVREFDSLRTLVYRRGLPDTVRVRLGSVACRYLMQLDLDSARTYGEKAVALARRIGFVQGEAHARNNLAAAIFYAGDYPAAQTAFEASLRAAQRARNRLFIGHAYLGLGSVARSFDNDDNAMKYYQQAREAYLACEPPNMRGLLLVMHNIANGYLDKEQAPLASPVVRQALAMARNANAEPSMQAKLLNLLGVIQSDLHRADSAVATWHEALRLARTSHTVSTEAAVLARLAEASLNNHKPAAALQYIRQALELNRQLGEQRAVADDLHVLALAMQQLKLPGAFDTLQKFLSLRDTLLSQERTAAVAEAQARFDRAGQQVRIQVLEQRQRIAGLEAEQRRTRTRLLLLSAVLAIGGTGFFLAQQYRRRQRAREQSLRRQIAADLHDDVGSLLTQISLQSELLSQGVYGPEQQERYLAH